MAIPFMTEEWAKAFMEAINHNDAYKEAAATWEGDFYFVAEIQGWITRHGLPGSVAWRMPRRLSDGRP